MDVIKCLTANLDDLFISINFNPYCLLSLSISCDQEDFPVNLSDLSKSGCSLHTSLEIDAGRTCSLHLRIGQRSHSIPVRVIWKKNERDKRQYGLKFIDMKTN